MQTNGPLTRPLAFVDVETTGLSPTLDRIAEVGVLIVDGDRCESFTTLLRSVASARTSSGDWEGAPRFADIAADLARRLEGRLVLAHNARFDYAFLAAEFERAGIAFEADVVCTVMLARKLDPALAHHDLDSLAQAHGLAVDARHRALPDADLLWRWWQSMRACTDGRDLEAAIAQLLEGPVLPAELDPAIVAALPRTPGAYVFHDERGDPLAIGAAGNLRAHVVNYFRLGRATRKALECAHRVHRITWRATCGIVGARLHAAALRATRRAARADVTLRFAPDATPCVSVVAVEDRAESFGVFASERKARNALARLACRHRLCHALLGIVDDAAPCLACPADGTRGGCRDGIARKKQLMRLYPLLRPLRIEAWPHEGPVAVRERDDLLLVDRWQFLGSARNDGDVHALLDAQREPFDLRLYELVRRELAKLPREKIVALGQRR